MDVLVFEAVVYFISVNICILGWILTQSEGLGELQGWCSDALLPLRTGNYKERQEKQRSSP